jgi:hypothetical protein
MPSRLDGAVPCSTPQQRTAGLDPPTLEYRCALPGSSKMLRIADPGDRRQGILSVSERFRRVERCVSRFWRFFIRERGLAGPALGATHGTRQPKVGGRSRPRPAGAPRAGELAGSLDASRLSKRIYVKTERDVARSASQTAYGHDPVDRYGDCHFGGWVCFVTFWRQSVMRG